MVGPGLPNWERARAILRGDAEWTPEAVEWPRPVSLPGNESRRVTPLVCLVLATAQQVLDGAGIDPKQTPSVFASAGGDLNVAQRLCRALTMPNRPVSPTLFNNSVHNAPAGYFSISSGSHRASTSIAAGEATAAAAMLEAASIARSERRPTLLAVYDVAPDEPMGSCAGVFSSVLAIAMLIDPSVDGGRSLRLSIDDTAAGRSRRPEALRVVAADNPAAALLPLLSLVARDAAGCVTLPHAADTTLRVELGHA